MSDIVLDENKTNNLIKELSDYYSDVESSLKNMSELILDMSSCFSGDIYDSIINKLSDFEDHFGIINDNLKSYIVDFKNLIYSFKEADSNIKIDFVNQTQNEGGELVNVKD